MFRQIIGAAVGSRIAAQAPAVGGATGVAIATAIPFVLSRMSIPAMLVIGAGGYVAKRYFEKNMDENGEQSAASKRKAEVPGTPLGTIIDPPSGISA